MPGTHRSLLQTGGRNEARFSSTQLFTRTGRSMVSRELCSERCPGAVGGAHLRPAAYWPPRLISIPGVKGRGNPGVGAGDPRGGHCQPLVRCPGTAPHSPLPLQAPARPCRTSGGAPHGGWEPETGVRHRIGNLPGPLSPDFPPGPQRNTVVESRRDWKPERLSPGELALDRSLNFLIGNMGMSTKSSQGCGAATTDPVKVILYPVTRMESGQSP